MGKHYVPFALLLMHNPLQLFFSNEIHRLEVSLVEKGWFNLYMTTLDFWNSIRNLTQSNSIKHIFLFDGSSSSSPPLLLVKEKVDYIISLGPPDNAVPFCF